MSDEVDIPDEFHDWPYEAKAFVLAEANTALDLRREIERRVGLERLDAEKTANQFKKEQLAEILMALGGPDGGDSQ